MKIENHTNGHIASTDDVQELLTAGGGMRGAAASPTQKSGLFDELLCRLQARRNPKSGGQVMLGLIGCEPRAGVTTMAANLAVRASELGHGPVLFVEMHRGNRSVSNYWTLESGPGLTELFAGSASLAECLQPGPSPDLRVLSAGMRRRGETVECESISVESFLNELSADFGTVIFDLPPAKRLRQALLLARRLDEVLLVVRAESSRKADAAKLAQRMVDDGLPLAGVLLNRHRSYVPRWMERWL